MGAESVEVLLTEMEVGDILCRWKERLSMGLNTILIIITANLLVGICVGITGVAGFLLPLVYMFLVGMSYEEAMMISFFTFMIIGYEGSRLHRKNYPVDRRMLEHFANAGVVGAIAAVFIRNYITNDMAMKLLYGMVFFAGVSNLIPKKQNRLEDYSRIKTWMIWAIGIFVAVVCALSGAGGPILLIPILMLIGVDAHEAIGVSMFQSVFIAIPTILGFAVKVDLLKILPLMVGCALIHYVGTRIGVRYSKAISHQMLKYIVSAIAIGVAIWKLFF